MKAFIGLGGSWDVGGWWWWELEGVSQELLNATPTFATRLGYFLQRILQIVQLWSVNYRLAIIPL